MGGVAYSSRFIMDRLKFKAKLEGYDDLFAGTLKSNEILGILNGFVKIANDIRANLYDDLPNDVEFIEALEDFKKRYKNEIVEPHDIMLEDWFFIIQAFFLKNDDLVANKEAAIVGFERLILDAIYNDGKIQELYKKIDNKKVIKYFKSCKNIFTLNYDNNIENLIGRDIYHVHGDFSVLADSENSECVLGFLRKEKGELVYQEKYRHCYCNALLNYSGKLKKKRIDDLKKSETNWNLMVEKCKCLPEQLDELKTIKNNEFSTYELVKTKIQHPELRFSYDYHLNDLSNIEGEIDIIGMSPNNDAHIFDLIFNNRKLNKIIFYYFSDLEKQFIEENYLDDRIECRTVKSLWSELLWKKSEYNCHFEMPKGYNIVEICKVFSGYHATEEQVLKSAGSVTDKEIERLCKLVKDDMNAKNPEHKPTSKHDFEKQIFSINYIALQEGILPPALFLLYVKYCNKI